MRVFQFNKFYPEYLSYFNAKHPESRLVGYAERLQQLFADRFAASLILAPAYQQNSDVRYTVVNDEILQHR